MDPIINYYQELAPKYDEDRFGNSYGRFIDRQERAILNKLGASLQGKVLDLACGSGRLLNYAEVGLDASSKMLDVAREKYPEKTLVLGPGHQTPFEDKTFDAILIFHFFMHLDEHRIHQILEECLRILKDEGRIIFDIPSKKRRTLFKVNPRNWHGAYALSLLEIKNHPKIELKRSFGLLFLPIHRLPTFLRHWFSALDLLLANSFLQEYSSYLIVEVAKKQGK